MRILPIFLGCALLAVPLPLRAAADARLFENLSGERSVEVEFDSTGCFHHITYEFEFRRGETLAAKVTEVTEKWDESKKPVRTTTRKVLGTVKLTPDEARGLDRLMAFYRKPKFGGCTTVDSISIKVMEGTETVATENYTDATCSIDKMQGVTLFADVVRKALLDKKRE